LKTKVGNFANDKSQADTKFNDTDSMGKDLVKNVEGRVRWIELLRAIDACLPPAEEPKPIDENAKDKQAARAKEIMERPDLHITNIDCQEVDDITAWKTATESLRPKPAGGTATTPGDATAAAGPVAAPTGDASGGTPAKSPSWIIQIAGYHYHNINTSDQAAAYLNRTLIKALNEKTVTLPLGDGKTEEASVKDLGISLPTIVKKSLLRETSLTDPNIEADAGGNEGTPSNIIKVQRFDFVVQSAWQPKTPEERRKAAKEAAKEAAEKAKQAAQMQKNQGQP
jgi:type IV pilus assembly protein PilM